MDRCSDACAGECAHGAATTARLAPGWADAVLRAVPWEPDPGPVLIVVPHPDDESLMFGGVLARFAAQHAPVHVLAVTDGEGAYPGVVDAGSLARVRSVEQHDALAELGLVRATVTRLGIPDGCVADHEDALVGAIAGIVADEGTSTVLAPWEHDHHTDHEACGRAVLRARRENGSSFAVVSGLFWSLLREPAPPGVTLAALALTSDELELKAAAIRRHRSQLDRLVSDVPVLSDHELGLTRWCREHVLVERPT